MTGRTNRWTGNAFTLLPLHMLLGIALVLMLWIIAVMALVARVNPILAVVALIWGAHIRNGIAPRLIGALVAAAVVYYLATAAFLVARLDRVVAGTGTDHTLLTGSTGALAALLTHGHDGNRSWLRALGLR